MLRTSKNPNRIILNAFKNVPTEILSRFAQVSLNHFIFKNSYIKKIESRKLSEFSSFSQAEFLKDVEDVKFFHYCHGLINNNISLIKAFSAKERRLNRVILSGSLDDSIKEIKKIKSEFGCSFWSENTEIAILALMKNHREYKVPDSCKNNDLVTVLLKVQSNNAENCYSNEDFFGNTMKCFEENDRSDIFDFIKYRTVGYNPKVDIDPFLVLKLELNATLIDFFKAFEFLCIKSLSEDSLCSVKDDAIIFLKSIEHESVGFLNKNEIVLSEYKCELDVMDCYSDSDYLSVIYLCEELDFFDIGLLKIYSKSLSYAGIRSLRRTMNVIVSNALADIFSKKSNFKESVNLLSNICMLLRYDYKFFLISQIIHNETGQNVASMSSVCDQLIVFSNIPTAFKVDIHYGRHVAGVIYREQWVDSKTYNLFEKLNDFNRETDFSKSNLRELKYFAKKIRCQRCYELALEIYEDNIKFLDCDMKKEYLVTLVDTNRVVQAARYFVELAEEYRDAISYFAIEKLHNSILKNLSSLNEIAIPIALFLYKDIKSGSLNKNATAISLANYVRNKNLNYPSEIDFLDEDRKAIFFLENVCNRDLLCKSMLFRYQKDAYDERIKICNLLTSRKLSNVDKLVFEAKELSKRKVLESASKYVSSSKVYADKDFIRTNTWDNFSNLYEELVDISVINEDMEKQLEVAMKKVSELNTSKIVDQSLIDLITRQVSTYLKIGDSKKAKLLFSLMKCAVEEYCFGMKGLNSYLSTRVRHGTLFSTLLGPFINEGMVSDDKITPQNEFLLTVNGIEPHLLERLLNAQISFNDRITKVVNDFVDKTIQIYANGKGEMCAAFNYEIETANLTHIQNILGDMPSVNDAWNAIENWISGKTNEGCSVVQKIIDNDLRESLVNSINSFEVETDKIISLSEMIDSNDVISKITKIRPELFNQLNVVRSWFDIDYSLTEQEYTFDIVADIAETMLRSKYIASEDCPQITIPHKVLSPMVDLIYNLLSNAIKHSNVERKELKINIKSTNTDGYFLIDMTNSSFFEGCLEDENVRLDMFKNELSPEQLKSLLQKEGGTGIAKIKSILKHDLVSNDFIDLKYNSQTEFVASIKLSKKSGVFSNENTYR